MARLSNIKRIIKEQLPSDVQKWIDTLLFPLNNAIAQFTSALTNSLTITDNLAGNVKTFKLKTSDFPFTFQHSLKSQPQICIATHITDAGGGTAVLPGAAYAQWDLGADGSSIIIRTVIGLDSTKTYNITFWTQTN